MRDLGQPSNLFRAFLAALSTSLACWPRFALWQTRQFPVIWLEAILFPGCFVLWAFVFAWYKKYSGRPILTLKISFKLFAAATAVAVLLAAESYFILDPRLRVTVPQDYPAGLKQWAAMLLFNIAMTQLFIIFAPFAWAMRLFKNVYVAIFIPVLLGLLIQFMRMQSYSAALSPGLYAALLFGRLFATVIACFLYWRGGILLVWWWELLFESRFLIDLN